MGLSSKDHVSYQILSFESDEWLDSNIVVSNHVGIGQRRGEVSCLQKWSAVTEKEASDFSEMLVALPTYTMSHLADITSTVFFLRYPNEKFLSLKPFGLVHRLVLKEKIN